MKARVAEHLSVHVSTVESARMDKGKIRALVNFGIGGTKVFIIAPEDLPPALPPKPAPKKRVKRAPAKKKGGK